MVETGQHVAIAFALVVGSALATGLGASVVFFPSLVKLASRRVLASSLSFAAGVMIYVSLIEIFQKSRLSFEDAGHAEGMASFLTTACFFGGILIMIAVDFFVKAIGGTDHHQQQKECSNPKNSDKHKCSEEEEVVIISPHCVGCSEDPIRELEEWQAKAERETRATRPGFENGTCENSADEKNYSSPSELPPVNDVFLEEDNSDTESGNSSGRKSPGSTGSISVAQKIEEAKEKKKLVEMGMSTALAIALHNFPEGLATFVAALHDPKVGAVLAIALGIHNIPEGLCVALPIYYATGNRMKGFMWGTLSGFSEPIGALIGWVVLANIISDDVYAVLFGVVSGMMTLISLKELIPTALRYDPNDTVSTFSCVAGMLVMAVSLVLFAI